ncbi:hypothetical protein [Streptomyces sp. NPDC002994]|uniref:hypothetical protein n=1 Tax=Streptomyces sp. NPDC002994 TaxID=3154441 RepID=UPI0033B28B5A
MADASGRGAPRDVRQAGRMLCDRLEREAGGEDSPLHGMVTMMGLACRSADGDNLKQAAVAPGCCETTALNL